VAIQTIHDIFWPILDTPPAPWDDDNFQIIKNSFYGEIELLMVKKMTCDILVERPPLPLECHMLFEWPLM